MDKKIKINHESIRVILENDTIYLSYTDNIMRVLSRNEYKLDIYDIMDIISHSLYTDKTFHSSVYYEERDGDRVTFMLKQDRDDDIISLSFTVNQLSDYVFEILSSTMELEEFL